MPARTPVPRLAVAIVLVLVLGRCGRATTPVVGATLVDGRDDALQVTFSGCDPDPPISVVETDTVVRVSIDQDGGGCEPLFVQVVELTSPLGDRRVIDNATGDEVPDAGD